MTLTVESCPTLDLSGLSAFLEVGPVVKSPCVSSLPFKLSFGSNFELLVYKVLISILQKNKKIRVLF